MCAGFPEDGKDAWRVCAKNGVHSNKCIGEWKYFQYNLRVTGEGRLSIDDVIFIN